MSTRANPTVIGGFVVGASVLLVAFLLFWGGTGFLRKKIDYVMFFDSAVTGLQKGAPVMFRGVRVGEVTDVQIRWGTPMVAVYIFLEPELLKGAPKAEVRQTLAEATQKGLRAQLRAQSFVTGVLYIALDSMPGTPIVLRGLDPKVPELPTVPTDIEMWMAKLEKFGERIANLPIEDIARGVTETLSETTRLLKSPEISDALKNTDKLVADTRTLVQKIDRFTGTLAAQIDPVAGDTRATLKAAQAALADVPQLVTDARATLKSTQTALADVPRLVEQVRGLAANADQLVTKVDTHADPLLASLQKTSDAAQTTLTQFNVTLGSVDGVLTQDSGMGYELVEVLQELRATARAFRSLADYLERVPDAPVYGVRRTGGNGR
jgi:phospholipid/cholesterol/gamma-HCH transport system substrate-binding protein